MTAHIPAEHATPGRGTTGEPVLDEDRAAAETRRLEEKFAAFRHLVPLALREDVLFLNSASAPPASLVVHEAVVQYSAEALHSARPHAGWRVVVEEVRGLLARCIGAGSAAEIAFTRDTTEGLGSVARTLRFARGDNVVLLDVEHPSTAHGWLALRDAAGLEVRQVPTRAWAGGAPVAVDAAALAPFVDARTRAVGLSSVAFDGGQRHAVAALCAALRPRRVHVVVDATQHVGFAALDVRALGVSAAAFSLHKGLGCPVGLGALYVAPDVFADDDDDDDDGRLLLPLPPPPIVGMAGVRDLRADLLVCAADGPLTYRDGALRFEHANVSFVAAVAARASLRFYLDVLGPADVEAHLYGLTEALMAACDRLGVLVVNPRAREHRAPHICVLGLGARGGWGRFLEQQGACVTPNRLGVRVSFGFYSDREDVRRFVAMLELGITRGLPV
ncbi:PLP-dependent transferase [Durotheca rogersii]|uniref:PLP-dependent transferase n=1 Tax=Durotheca rogersii TaxID=419775 RepID=UPI002220C2E4|nr:PLP-dependent transferase [Durotheca rogersii]KAI5863734.1 PLP-dependent transferase [Durotheca rogersii]